MLGPWYQDYDPLANRWLATLCAALPVFLLCYMMAFRRTAAWKAALAGMAAGVALALWVFGMPAPMLAGAVAHAVVFGLVRVVLTLAAAVFAYDLVVESGSLPALTATICGISPDRNVHILLVAFAFSSILEGTGGGGAPVAISASILIGLGVEPFRAALLALLGNTIPVVFGAMGNPLRTLAAVTGLDERALSIQAAGILAPLAIITPFSMVLRDSGLRGLRECWGAALTVGVSFTVIFLLGARFADIAVVAVLCGVGALATTAFFILLRGAGTARIVTRESLRAWLPFGMLILFIVIWGLPGIKGVLEYTTFRVPVPGLHMMVVRHPPVVPQAKPEPAIFEVAWLAGAGTAGILSGIVSGLMLGLGWNRTWKVLGRSLYRIRPAVVAILGMLSLGFLTRYCGMDAVLGLALASTGALFPFFGTMLGWLGVLLTGTNAGSNALFGSLQTITARQLGLSEVMMAAANAAGGVMGKMVNAQSLVVGCAAASITGREGDLFRALFRYSLGFAGLAALIVAILSYWP